MNKTILLNEGRLKKRGRGEESKKKKRGLHLSHRNDNGGCFGGGFFFLSSQHLHGELKAASCILAKTSENNIMLTLL